MGLKEKILKLILPSKKENILKLESFLEQVYEKHNVISEQRNDISLALNEAVNNSIIHGNQCDPNKDVNITAEGVNEGTLRFVITDQGKGFNPSSIPDPTAPDRVTLPNGRGVFLINELASRVKVTGCNDDCDGCSLEMEFDLKKAE